MTRGSLSDPAAPRVLLTGASGFLGTYILAALRRQGRAHALTLGRSPTDDLPLDLADIGDRRERIAELSPTHVIHAAAISSIDACFRDQDRARRVNVDSTEILAKAAAKVGARVLFFSTDQVFDGEGAPYAESSTRRPLHVYGQTKAAAEDALTAHLANAVILRTSLVFGPSPVRRRSPSDAVLDAEKAKRPIGLFVDELRSPVSARFVAAAVLELLESPFRGVLNLCGPEGMSRAEFGSEVARAAGIPRDAAFRPVSRLSVAFSEPRPRDLRLSTELLRATISEPHGSICDEMLRFGRLTS